MEAKQIEIAAAEVHKRIHEEVEYLAAKRLSGDSDSYRRISMIPGDERLTSGYIMAALNLVAVQLREYNATAEVPYVVSRSESADSGEERGEAKFTLKFDAQGNQQIDEELLRRELTGYVVCSTVGKWLEIVEPKESERYKYREELHLKSILQMMYKRIRPGRPESQSDNQDNIEADEQGKD